jgi:hypothetical protein
LHDCWWIASEEERKSWMSALKEQDRRGKYLRHDHLFHLSFVIVMIVLMCCVVSGALNAAKADGKRSSISV